MIWRNAGASGAHRGRGDAGDVQHRIPFAGEVAVDYVRRAGVLPDCTVVNTITPPSAQDFGTGTLTAG